MNGILGRGKYVIAEMLIPEAVCQELLHTTPAAIMCAINDALVPLGTRANEVPAAPNRLWKLIRAARNDTASE